MKKPVSFKILIIIFFLAGSLVGSWASASEKTSSASSAIDSAIRLALVNKNNEAISLLKNAVRSAKDTATQERIAATLGRVYYQGGKFAEAIEQYDKISKDSPYWIPSLEEKAWAHYQLKNSGKSLAILKTLVNPIFSEAVSPEIYFLQSLNQLKMCDYNGIFKTIELFKKNVKEPLAAAEQKAKAGDRLAVARVKEFSETISKVQLVEVEAIQYVFVSDPSNKSRPTTSKISSNSKQLVFPESDEVWVDEIDSYQVQAKGCPSAQGVL